MKRLKLYNVLMLVAGVLASASCVCICADPEPLDEESSKVISIGNINIDLGTKISDTEDYTGTTFRFCLFNATSHFFSGFEGTYCLPNPTKDPRWLTPCKVDGSTGAYDSGDAAPEATINGLQARNGTYYLVMASPAVSMQSPKKDIYGFYYDRARTPGEKPLCISDSIKVVISGSSIDGNNLYFVNDTIRLKERRAKFKFSISCGDDISSAVVKEVRLANILSKAYYMPIERTLEYEELDAEEIAIETFEPAITLYKEDDIEAGHKKNYFCDFQPYVLSLDYSKIDEYGKPLYPLPEIVIGLGEDGGQEVRIPVAWNLLPENTYKCHITINSCYVQLFLSVLDWEGPNDVSCDNSSYVFGDIHMTVPIWEDGILGTGGDTEIHDSEW